jgi:acetyl esterase/lipase
MRTKVGGLGLGLAMAAAIAVAADAPRAGDTLKLWPGKAPGETGTVGEEKAKTQEKDGKTVVTSLTNVSTPTLSLYPAPADKATGVAVVVCPGGGYNNLAWDHEGEQVARWLNSIGVTAAVLKYRVPRREGTPKGEPPPQALMDAQRALSLVRSKAADWGVDPKRIGILGFSAGGHLGAWASTNSDKRAYESVDDADKVSCRPDFAVLIYTGGAVKRGSDELSKEIKIASDTPPMFLVQAHNDQVNPENSVRIYLALKRAGVPAELHIYSSGGHGFGLRPTGKPSATWPARCEEWMRDQGILKPAAGGDRAGG